MWCSWGEDAGRRPDEELGDELTKAPPASGRGSVGKSMARVTLYSWPGPKHESHCRWPHTGQHSSVISMRFPSLHSLQIHMSTGTTATSAIVNGRPI